MKTIQGVSLLIAFALGIFSGRVVQLPRASAHSPCAVGPMSSSDTPMMRIMFEMQVAMCDVKVTGKTAVDFMQMMIPHHRAAIEMAHIELKYGTNPHVRSLARSIISSQSEEVTEMSAWLHAMYGINPK